MATLLYTRLKEDGYHPFLDIETLRSGKFNEQLYDKIAECGDFLCVLPPSGLDRCKNADDWIRLEIARAIELKKNIVPVLMRGFSFPAICLRTFPNWRSTTAFPPAWITSMPCTTASKACSPANRRETVRPQGKVRNRRVSSICWNGSTAP